MYFSLKSKRVVILLALTLKQRCVESSVCSKQRYELNNIFNAVIFSSFIPEVRNEVYAMKKVHAQ